MCFFISSLIAHSFLSLKPVLGNNFTLNLMQPDGNSFHTIRKYLIFNFFFCDQINIVNICIEKKNISIYFLYNKTSFLMELNPLLKTKNSNSETNVAKKGISYTSPRIEDYHKMATKYQKYIEELSPRIETICEKENYRTYLKEQKLNMIRTQLAKRKIELETKLEEKKDPIKSANGPLHLEINELTKLEETYKRIKQSLERSVAEKQQECKQIQKIVEQQTHIIKGQLRQSFASCYLKEKVVLPKLIRNMSDSAFLTRQRSDSHLSRSRESVMSKLNQTTEQKMAEKLSIEEQKLILLKLFGIYARSQQNDGQSHLSLYLIEEIQRDIEAKTKLIEEVKALMQNS